MSLTTLFPISHIYPNNVFLMSFHNTLCMSSHNTSYNTLLFPIHLPNYTSYYYYYDYDYVSIDLLFESNSSSLKYSTSTFGL